MRIFHKECGSLARAGHEVHLVAGNTESGERGGIHIHAVKKETNRIGRMFRTVPCVYREAVRVDADIYHFHDPELIPAGVLLKLRGKKVVYDIHEDYSSWITFNESIPSWLRHPVARAFTVFEGLIVRNFDALVTVTPSIRDRFASLNRCTVLVRNFPLSGEFDGETGDDIPWESREDSVCYIGGIFPKRGLSEMLSAVELLRETRPVRLLLGGDLSPAGREIMDGLSPETAGLVEYSGYVSRPRMREIFRRSKAGLIILHPERNFTVSYPTKLFEYMAAGLPVICSDFPLFRELDEGVNCCRFVDPLDSGAVADAIRYLLEHPREAEEMGKRGRAAVLDRYSWESEEKTLLSLYHAVLR